MFEVKPTLYKDTTLIDFEKRQITFLRYDTFTGAPIWQYHYGELDEYLRSTRSFYLFLLWLESEKKKIKTELDKRFKEPDMYRVLLREYEQFRDQFPRKYQTATQHRNAPRGAVLNLFSSLRYMAQRINRSDEVEQFLSAYDIPEA